MNDRIVSLDASQYDKVAQIPMQDAWQAQTREFIDFQAQGTTNQANRCSDIDQDFEVQPFKRKTELTAQCAQIRIITMGRRAHGQASQTAFRGFSLQYHRHFLSLAQV
jgi:hypothetical protein